MIALLALLAAPRTWNLTVWEHGRRPECVFYASGRDSAPYTATCTPFCVEFTSGPKGDGGKFSATILSAGDCDAECRAPAVEAAGLREVPCAVPQS